MPPRQAWQYIRTNGLLTYWAYTARPSPPFMLRNGGGGGSYSQRYVTSRNSYAVPRYSNRPASSWSSYYDSGLPNRVPYQAAAPTRYQSRYMPAPAPAPAPARSYARPERPQVVETRPSPPPSAPRPRRDRQEPPTTRMPVEEPDQRAAPPPPPVVRNDPPPAPTAPPMPSITSRSNNNSGAGAAKTAADLPYGTPVPGRTNMVNSPYAGKTQLVDVSGMGPGQTVKCPYTGKLFKVPPTQQASNEAEPRLEAKPDAPKLSSEPKGEDKKP